MSSFGGASFLLDDEGDDVGVSPTISVACDAVSADAFRVSPVVVVFVVVFVIVFAVVFVVVLTGGKGSTIKL
ncbi:hypothetical protein GCM10007877_31010 [Marinibactrum halimedae]|uniref:Transmembrane protein n=1 Tax=Marinibactrum halimedae TaxID=1444977 RepID=A0AA37WQK1_9GAMM|nr:hypothetical protein GCM10007877_31010 [Marinibactrum halimedae]